MENKEKDKSLVKENAVKRVNMRKRRTTAKPVKESKPKTNKKVIKKERTIKEITEDLKNEKEKKQRKPRTTRSAKKRDDSKDFAFKKEKIKIIRLGGLN